jgi:hypothetical protein
MSAGVEVPISAMVIAPAVVGIAAIGAATAIGAVAYKTAEEIVDIASDFKGIELPLTEIQDPKTGFTIRLEIDASGIGFRKVSLSQLEDELRNSTADFAKKAELEAKVLQAEQWSKRIENEFNKKIAYYQTIEHLKVMKETGQITTFEEREQLNGAIVFEAQTSEGIKYKYMVATTGNIITKTEGIKGKACEDILKNEVKSLVGEDFYETETSKKVDIKFTNTSEIQEIPTEKEKELNEIAKKKSEDAYRRRMEYQRQQQIQSMRMKVSV